MGLSISPECVARAAVEEQHGKALTLSSCSRACQGGLQVPLVWSPDRPVRRPLPRLLEHLPAQRSGHVLEWRYETANHTAATFGRTVGCCWLPYCSARPVSRWRGLRGGRQRSRSAQRLHGGEAVSPPCRTRRAGWYMGEVHEVCGPRKVRRQQPVQARASLRPVKTTEKGGLVATDAAQERTHCRHGVEHRRWSHPANIQDRDGGHSHR